MQLMMTHTPLVRFVTGMSCTATCPMALDNIQADGAYMLGGATSTKRMRWWLEQRGAIALHHCCDFKCSSNSCGCAGLSVATWQLIGYSVMHRVQRYEDATTKPAVPTTLCRLHCCTCAVQAAGICVTP
jgi:hypothetical protein